MVRFSRQRALKRKRKRNRKLKDCVFFFVFLFQNTINFNQICFLFFPVHVRFFFFLILLFEQMFTQQTIFAWHAAQLKVPIEKINNFSSLFFYKLSIDSGRERRRKKKLRIKWDSRDVNCFFSRSYFFSLPCERVRSKSRELAMYFSSFICCRMIPLLLLNTRAYLYR